jgi:hypothetical protein
LDLSSYELPPIDLLVDHGTGELTVTKEELEENKDRIVETWATTTSASTRSRRRSGRR